MEPEYDYASWTRNGTGKPRGRQEPEFVGSSREIEKGYPKFEENSVPINRDGGFEGVPEQVWEFVIGGYQVCEKWLKDRRGRALSDDDIEHYQMIIVAIGETIRIMGEIDEVIEEHGGWPGAFQAAGAGE